MTLNKLLFIRGDRGGRRSGLDRRLPLYDAHAPERRAPLERRIGKDRRWDEDRRSGDDRRVTALPILTTDRRDGQERRNGHERRASFSVLH